MISQVVPMENLNGRRLVEGGDLCERRNGHAIDFWELLVVCIYLE